MPYQRADVVNVARNWLVRAASLGVLNCVKFPLNPLNPAPMKREGLQNDAPFPHFGDARQKDGGRNERHFRDFRHATKSPRSALSFQNACAIISASLTNGEPPCPIPNIAQTMKNVTPWTLSHTLRRWQKSSRRQIATLSELGFPLSDKRTMSAKLLTNQQQSNTSTLTLAPPMQPPTNPNAARKAPHKANNSGSGAYPGMEFGICPVSLKFTSLGSVCGVHPAALCCTLACVLRDVLWTILDF